MRNMNDSREDEAGWSRSDPGGHQIGDLWNHQVGELIEFSRSYLPSHKPSPEQRNEAHSSTLAFYDTGQALPVCLNFVGRGM